jgi:hypothetical protein
MTFRFHALFMTFALLAPRETYAQEVRETVDLILRSTLNLVELRAVMEQMVVQQAATFPLGASSGSFVWGIDTTSPSLQFRHRTSFGPMFVERASTLGNNHLKTGLSWQRVTFESVAGQPLRHIQTTPVHNARVTQPTTTSLAITLERAVAQVSFGMTDTLDVGVALPFGQSAVDGFRDTSYVCTEVDDHYCPTGSPVVFGRVAQSATSWGVGDAIVRVKKQLLTVPRDALLFDDRLVELAGGLELILPTGDPDKLMGRGHLQTKASLFGGSVYRWIEFHYSGGYTFGGRGLECDPSVTVTGNCTPPAAASAVLTSDLRFISEPSPEVNYAFGGDVTFGDITVAGDVIGRALRHAPVMDFRTVDVGGVHAGTGFAVSRGTVNLLLLGIGAKKKLGRSSIVAFNMLVPLNDNGLKIRAAPMVAFEHSFPSRRQVTQ